MHIIASPDPSVIGSAFGTSPDFRPYGPRPILQAVSALGLVQSPEAEVPPAGHRERAFGLKSRGTLADTFHMPIIVMMELPYESDQPGSADAGDTPAADPTTQGTDGSGDSGQENLTPERLAKVIRRLETGFYDSPEVREHIARRVREELGP
jgi:hypothetical protein